MINQIHKTGLKYLVTQLHAMLHSGNDKILDFSSSAFVPLDLAELHFPCRCSYLLFCIYAYASSSIFSFTFLYNSFCNQNFASRRMEEYGAILYVFPTLGTPSRTKSSGDLRLVSACICVQNSN